MSYIPDRTKAPEIHSFSRLTLPPVSRMTLDNGASLISLDAGDRDLTRVTVARDGGIIESPIPGLTVISPELGNEGSKNYTGDEIADIIDFNGAWQRSGSHLHHITTTLTALTSKISALLPIIADTVSNPLYPEDSIKAVAEKAAAKLSFNQERVSYHASRGLSELTKGKNHPAARETTPDDILQITRRDLLEYQQKSLNTSKLTVFASGRVSPATIDIINKTIGSIKSTGSGIELDYTPYQPSTDTKTARYDKPGSLQTAISMGIPSISRLNADYIPLRLAVIALGGYFGSRLMKNIREDKGLTYGIGTALVGGIEGSTIEIHTEADNHSVRQVIDEVKIEIEKIKNPDSFTDDEIERLRRYMMTTLASALDSPFSIMETYANILYSGTPVDYFDRQQEEVSRMTAESIASAAVKYFDLNKLYISTAGDLNA